MNFTTLYLSLWHTAVGIVDMLNCPQFNNNRHILIFETPIPLDLSFSIDNLFISLRASFFFKVITCWQWKPAWSRSPSPGVNGPINVNLVEEGEQWKSGGFDKGGRSRRWRLFFDYGDGDFLWLQTASWIESWEESDKNLDWSPKIEAIIPKQVNMLQVKIFDFRLIFI